MVGEIIKGVPPNYEKIRKVFGAAIDDAMEKKQGPVFAYGGKIYNPDGGPVSHHTQMHESVHFMQQGPDPEGWWDRYLTDVEFRLSQEIEAYATEYLFIKTQAREKVSKWFLEQFASMLASDLYGKIVTYTKAHSMLRHRAKELSQKNASNK